MFPWRSYAPYVTFGPTFTVVDEPGSFLVMDTVLGRYIIIPVVSGGEKAAHTTDRVVVAVLLPAVAVTASTTGCL